MSVVALRKQAFDQLCKGNIDHACEILCEILISTGMKKRDCWNLAFVTFKYASLEIQERLYSKIAVHDIRKLSERHQIWLMLSFELSLQKQNAKERVQEEYIKNIVRLNIRTHPGRSILHWHIPKCSGTSITEALGKYYYNLPVPEIIPGYAYKPLLIYLAREQLSEFPYFSSMHIGMKELSPESGYFGFTILRDPVKRCLSMFRQQFEGRNKPAFIKLLAKRFFARFVSSKDIPISGLYYHHVLPRYGWFWDYTRDSDFDSWKRNIPRGLLMRQLTTFSDEFNIHEAIQNIERQDYVLFRDYNIGSEIELLDMLDIPKISVSVPKTRNKSSTRIKIDKSLQMQLKNDLDLEYKLLDSLRITETGKQ